MFIMKLRNLPSVVKHHGQTAYHNVNNKIPCFYVIVPDDVDDIDCHGGVTFGDYESCEDDDGEVYEFGEREYEVPGHEHVEVPEGYHVLGWDYAHCDDDDLTDEEIIADVKETLELLECKTL